MAFQASGHWPVLVLELRLFSVFVDSRNEAFEIALEDGFLIPTKNEMNAMGLVAEGR